MLQRKSVCEPRNSTTPPVVQREVARSVRSCQSAECERGAGGIVSSLHTPPLGSRPSPLRSGDWVQIVRQPHCWAVTAVSARSALILSSRCSRKGVHVAGSCRGNIHIHSMTVDVLLNLIWQQGQLSMSTQHEWWTELQSQFNIWLWNFFPATLANNQSIYSWMM